MTLYEKVKEYLINELENHSEVTVYACDLANELTYGINMNGTVEFSTYGTIEKMKEYWDEYGSVFAYMEDNFGKALNPFDNPEVFDTQSYYIIAGDILSNCDFIDKNWNEEVTLDEETVMKIIGEIEEIEKDYFEW